MKAILPLLILISLFSYLLAGRFSCPSYNYVCCSSESSNTCKCVKLGVEAKCRKVLKCGTPSKRPTYIQDGTKIKGSCD